MVKSGPERCPWKKVPWWSRSLSESESWLIREAVRERRVLLIVAYGLMEVEEVSDLVDLSQVPDLDSEVEVEPAAVLALVEEDCWLVPVPKGQAWHTGPFSIRASPTVIQLR